MERLLVGNIILWKNKYKHVDHQVFGKLFLKKNCLNVKSLKNNLLESWNLCIKNYRSGIYDQTTLGLLLLFIFHRISVLTKIRHVPYFFISHKINFRQIIFRSISIDGIGFQHDDNVRCATINAQLTTHPPKPIKIGKKTINSRINLRPFSPKSTRRYHGLHK